MSQDKRNKGLSNKGKKKIKSKKENTSFEKKSVVVNDELKEVFEKVEETNKKIKNSVIKSAAKLENDLEEKINVLKTEKSISKTKKQQEKVKIDEKQEFKMRLDERYDELKWLYIELYENMGYLNDLVYNIEKIYMVRESKFKNLDRKRLNDPNWYKDGKLVELNLETNIFNKDFNGLADKIDYVKELGANYLNLNSVLQTPEYLNDYGNAISNFREIESKLGGEEGLKNLVNLCHKRNLNVGVDFVMNHTSDEHQWALKAKSGLPEYLNRYICCDDYNIVLQFEKNLPYELPESAPGNFTYIECINKHVMTTFNPYEWDLNYRNPIVFNEVIYNILYLANLGVDVISLKKLPFIWKQIGTNCRNLQQVHNITRMLRLIIEIVCPGVILEADISMPYDVTVSYFGSKEKPECHFISNETIMSGVWNSLATRDIRMLKDQIDKISLLPNDFCFINYLRVNDSFKWNIDDEVVRRCGFDQFLHNKFLGEFMTGNFDGSFSRGEYGEKDSFGRVKINGTTASLCGLEKALFEKDQVQIDKALDRISMIYALVISLKGIPMINSGDEIGVLNDYSYKQDSGRNSDNRNLNKVKFDWDKAGNRKVKNSLENKIFSKLRSLINSRTTHEVFYNDSGLYTFDSGDISVLSFVRNLEDKKLFAVFNFCEDNKSINLPEVGEFVNLKTGRKIKVSKNISLKPYDFILLYKG